MKLREAVWQVEKLVPGGAGMARLADGSIGFVEGALPGERVSVEIYKARKGFAEGRLLRVLDASAERVKPPCEIAERCGGCDWQHIGYAAQLTHKAEIIAEALRRTGGFRELPAIQVVASPNELGYRSRLRVHIDERGQVGFFEKRSHRLISVMTCPVASRELDRALGSFQEAAASLPQQARLFDQAELRVSESEPERVVVLHARQDSETARRAAATWIERLEQDFRVAIHGSPAEFSQRHALSSELFLEIAPEAFVQVNWAVNLLLVEHVVAEARARNVKRFLDAYAGAGNFTLPLAAAGLSGTSVEVHPAAARSARALLARHGFSHVDAVADDAAHALAKLAREQEHFDLVLLDPPRAGATTLLEPLLALAPPYIAYCSCDPVTLARDSKQLAAGGYHIESVRGFDMFPGTHHVETLVWFKRSGVGLESEHG